MEEAVTNDEFRALLDTLTALSRPFTLVPLSQIHEAIRACEHAQALGPIAEPTVYLNGGAARLAANERFLRAVAAFRTELDALRPAVTVEESA